MVWIRGHQETILNRRSGSLLLILFGQLGNVAQQARGLVYGEATHQAGGHQGSGQGVTLGNI
jgi:hypothetical protein